MMSAPISKAVIPAAGFGTRMLPAAKMVAKELLPILDRPTIQYIVEEAAGAGIGDVVLVTAQGKQAIEQHFRPHQKLEARLRASGKLSLLASINELMAKVRVHAVDQPEQLGLGDAVRQARNLVKNEPFLCLLGDAVFSGESPSKQLTEAYRTFGTSIIGLEEVPLEKVNRYGIVGGVEIQPGVLKLDTLIEKPAPEQAPSRYAIAARYILSPAIFDCLSETKPGAGGEIQLTDALKLLLAREPIHGVVLRGRRHDIGNPIDWLKTNLIFAARDKTIWKLIGPLVRELMMEDGD
jgi:UTP--glucose-1-phosphate uridylyltransferase